MSEHAKDLLVALGSIAVGAAALLIIAHTPGEPHVVGTQTLTFATLPTAYAIFIIGLSALLAAGALREVIRSRRAPDGAKVKAPDGPGGGVSGAPYRVVWFRTVATVVLLIAYALLLEHLHFMLLTTLFLAVMFVVYGQRSPARVAAVAVGGGAGFYALFILALNLPI